MEVYILEEKEKKRSKMEGDTVRGGGALGVTALLKGRWRIVEMGVGLDASR